MELQNNIKIFFDERLHKYTDDRGNLYTSVTTVIGNYYEEFNTEEVALACEKVGKNPSHPKYLKYKGKSAAMIKAEWNKTKEDSLINGNKKHDYLENVIKRATGYKMSDGTELINDRLYTVDDILNNIIGELDLSWFDRVGIKERYPLIYNAILILHNNGFRFFAEIGVFNINLLISGKIDLLAVKGNTFIIVDWKTNKDDIKYDSGYFEKDKDGKTTDIFIYTQKLMKAPLSHLADSTGNHYNLQISGYAWLIEQFGLTNLGNIIFQIRENPNGLVEKVDRLTMFDYRENSKQMFEHYYNSRTLKQQLKILM